MCTGAAHVRLSPCETTTAVLFTDTEHLFRISRYSIVLYVCLKGDGKGKEFKQCKEQSCCTLSITINTAENTKSLVLFVTQSTGLHNTNSAYDIVQHVYGLIQFLILSIVWISRLNVKTCLTSGAGYSNRWIVGHKMTASVCFQLFMRCFVCLGSPVWIRTSPQVHQVVSTGYQVKMNK